MAIRIGTIGSLGKTRDLEIIPDDRQALVQTIGGVVVEDYGVVADGEVISMSAIFSAADYETLKSYWSTRQLVTVTLDDGTVIQNARVVIKRVRYADDLFNAYKEVNFEVWRV